MIPSSSSTALLSASKFSYAYFFDLERVFRCGCSSDVQDFPTERNLDGESEHDEAAGEMDIVSQHNDECREDNRFESARDCMSQISKELASIEVSKRQDTDFNHGKGIGGVFRMAAESISTINTTQFPDLKKTVSESTQITEAVSDDELSLASEEDAGADEDPGTKQSQPEIVSILRRKEKLGAIRAASGIPRITFCPTTVFPDPNETPKKRRRVKRLPRAAGPTITIIPCDKYESHCTNDEPRRLERRTKQNQYHPGHDFLHTTDSFYVFR